MTKHERSVGFVDGILGLYRRQAPAVRKTNGRQAGSPSARNAAIVSSGER